MAHEHKYSINENGDGETDVIEGHSHQIVRYEIQPAVTDDNHLHSHKMVDKEAQANNVVDYGVSTDALLLIADIKLTAKVPISAAHFSDMYLTKDEHRNVRYFFTFDYAKYIFERSPWSGILSNLDAFSEARAEILAASDIITFKLSRHSSNPNEGPVPVALSLDDQYIQEISVSLTNQSQSPDSLLRYYTGVDTGVKDLVGGTYHYVLEIGISDVYDSLVKEKLANLQQIHTMFQPYVERSRQAGSEKCDKFTQKTAEDLTKMRYILSKAIKTYIETLSFFVTGENSKFFPSGVPDYFKDKIERMAGPTSGTDEGVTLFNVMLENLISKLEDLIKNVHDPGGLEDDSIAPTNNSSAGLKEQVISAIQIFKQTINAEFTGNCYIDNIKGVDTISSSDKSTPKSYMSPRSSSPANIGTDQSKLPDVNSFIGLTVYTMSEVDGKIYAQACGVNPTVEEELAKDGTDTTYDENASDPEQTAEEREAADRAAEQAYEESKNEAPALSTNEGAAISAKYLNASALSAMTVLPSTGQRQGGTHIPSNVSNLTVPSNLEYSESLDKFTESQQDWEERSPVRLLDSSKIDILDMQQEDRELLIEILTDYQVVGSTAATTYSFNKDYFKPTFSMSPLGSILLKSPNYQSLDLSKIQNQSANMYYLCRQTLLPRTGTSTFGIVPGTDPEVINRYFLLKAPVAQLEGLGNLAQNLNETITMDNPVTQSDLYTNGNEYKLTDGSDTNYVGYYHIHKDGTVMTGRNMGSNEQVLLPIDVEAEPAPRRATQRRRGGY